MGFSKIFSFCYVFCLTLPYSIHSRMTIHICKYGNVCHGVSSLIAPDCISLYLYLLAFMVILILAIVAYITLHYITFIALHWLALHYITVHYLTLDYITLHIYIAIMCI